MKQYIIDNWLLKRTQLTTKSLTETQLGQAWARLGFAIAGLLYVWLHGNNFSQYAPIFLTASAAYFLYNSLTILRIRRHPLSAFRTIAAPLFDIFIVSFAMLVDGDQSSSIYFIYLVIILGNGFRFGNALLLYTQILSLLGLLVMTAYAYALTPVGIDLSLLFWQVAALLVVPYYVYLLEQSAEKAIKARYEVEAASFNLLDKGPVPVFTFELDASNSPCILYANRATNEAFTQAHSMLIGQCVDTLVLPEDRAEMVQFCLDTMIMEAAAEHSTVNHVYIRGIDKTGNILKLTCTAMPMRWQNRWIGVCFMLDITQSETLQKQLEAVHRQGYMSTLVAGIVHDFRNVLNNMIGYAELLHMGSTDNETRHQLAAIIAAGDRGSDLITHLLKLTRNQNTAIPPSFTTGDMLTQPLENIIGLSRLQMPLHIQLMFDIEKSLPDIAISVIEVEQVLLNLINNAMQAMPSAGQIRVSIKVDHQHRLAGVEQGALCIRVSDNGPGISEENLDNVFKPFWTSRSDTGGSGLGLAMVQRIIKRHHGSIVVDSIVNQQTTFTIHIPPFCGETAPVAAATWTAQAGNSGTRQWPSIAPCHILMVDDTPEILKVHEAMLSRMGHSVDTAQNGQQALILFKKYASTYDLIITDYRMPVMDGLELIEHIRALDSQMPILMITAYGEDQSLQRASQYGAVLMSKPVTIDRLSNGISEAIRSPRNVCPNT